MSGDLLEEESRRRIEVLRHLDRHLARLAEAIRGLDREAEVYLFGSAAEAEGEERLLSGDVDVLVVTDLPPGEVMARLWEEGFSDPFEIHVVTRDVLDVYGRRSKLVRVV